MLIGKLCQHPPKDNISFCLAQLKINDKIMNDHIKIYKDALSDDDIFKNSLLYTTLIV